MTCGFMNSAGTDLDSLFLINNSNGGALGFQCSNGQDLGNRFSASSKLNYAVGFQNSAGTDIGYLRGAGSTPVLLLITQHLTICITRVKPLVIMVAVKILIVTNNVIFVVIYM